MDSESTQKQFYYLNDKNEPTGPFTWDSLGDKVMSGEMLSNTMVCQSDSEEWVAFSERCESCGKLRSNKDRHKRLCVTCYVKEKKSQDLIESQEYSGRKLNHSERAQHEKKRARDYAKYANQDDDAIAPKISGVLRFLGVAIALIGVIVALVIMTKVNGGIGTGVQMIFSSLTAGALLYAVGLVLNYLVRITKALETKD